MTSLGEQMHGETLWSREEERAGALTQEQEMICIKGPAFFEQRPSALERFKRRVDEIARAAEIGGSSFLPGPHAGEQTDKRRGQVRARQQPRTLGPGTRDSVPFGLKRRVAVGLPVFDGQERRGPADRNRLLRDDWQLQQIRRAIRQTALDLLADMLDIDAGFQEALAARRDGRR